MEQRVQLDGVLAQLGSFGPHHVATLAMLALVYATNSMYNVNFVFAVEDVDYRCKIPVCESVNTSTSLAWLNESKQSVEVPDWKCSRPTAAHCPSLAHSRLVPCTEWEYDNPHSFIAEFDLACQEWKPTLVGTAHSFGNTLGLLMQGQISDRWGRKTAAVFAGSMGAVLGLTKSFATNFWCYVALETLEAAIGDALSPIFMLSIELVEKKRAVLFQMILLNCYTCGLILMPLIAYLVPYWRYFLRIIYAPTLLILTYSFFLDESIRWLYSKGKKERAIKLIQKIAKRNNVKMDVTTLHRLEYVDEETNSGHDTDKKLLIKTFKSKIMMQRFLVCLVWWFTITLINYGMMISSVLIAGNKYLNFALLMMMDIPANVFYWLVLAKYKRKIPLLLSFMVGGMFCILQPFVPTGYAWLAVALFMSFEMLATFSYNIVYIYTSELFPTYTRNSLHSACCAVGRLGALLAPQTPLLMSFWSGLPTFLFGITSLLAGFLTLLMPETANSALPDTVMEAENIGRKPQPVALLLTDQVKMENNIT